MLWSYYYIVGSIQRHTGYENGVQVLLIGLFERGADDDRRESTVGFFLHGETALQSATTPAILWNIILATFGKCLIVCGEVRGLVGWY